MKFHYIKFLLPSQKKKKKKNQRTLSSNPQSHKLQTTKNVSEEEGPPREDVRGR